MRFERLPFETAIFGRPCSRLHGPVSGLRRALEARGDYLVSCRTETDDAKLIDAGFVHVEMLITFEREAKPLPPPPGIKMAEPRDIEACVAIGRSAFVHDRFHADKRLPKARADALKAEWVRNDLTGRADACFVARRYGLVAGFVLCLKQDGVAIIDLIAVKHGQHGRRLGRALMLAAIAHYSGQLVRAGTQESNVASIKLYRSLGFTEVGRSRTYHWMAT